MLQLELAAGCCLLLCAKRAAHKGGPSRKLDDRATFYGCASNLRALASASSASES